MGRKGLAAAIVAGTAVTAAGMAVVRGRREARDLDELERRLGSGHGAATPRFDPAMVEELPEPARRFLRHALAPGTRLARAARFDTRFWMKLRPEEPHTELTGEEVLASWGFLWRARARMGLMAVRVRDHYADGQGAVAVTALRVVPLVRSGGPDVTRSARDRLAIERVVWLPSSLVPGMAFAPEEEPRWEAQGDERVRLTLRIDGHDVPITLRTARDGRLREATLQRWGDQGVDAHQGIPYGVTVEREESFGGLTIPTRLAGGWWYGTERYRPDDASRLTLEGVPGTVP